MVQGIIRKINTERERIISEYTQTLRKNLGSKIIGVVLFGSQARGDAHEGSDYDFLLLVNDDSPGVREAVLNTEAELMDRYHTLVGTIISTPEKWERQKKMPLGINILREGVAV